MLGKSVLRRRHECENDLVTVQETTIKPPSGASFGCIIECCSAWRAASRRATPRRRSKRCRSRTTLTYGHSLRTWSAIIPP
jgi:hypothetical protein